MYMKDAIAEYGFDCRIRKLSPKTIDCYTKQLRYFQEYLEQNHAVTYLEQVKKAHIKSFLAMMDSKNRKPQYINDLLKVFKTFFAYTVREGHIHNNPTAGIKNVKQPKVKIITFSELEIRRMLNYYHGRDYLSTRNRTMIALFFDTGMRLNEVMTLCPEQIRDDHILVHGKGNKERMVPVSPYLAKALMQFQIVRGGYQELANQAERESPEPMYLSKLMRKYEAILSWKPSTLFSLIELSETQIDVDTQTGAVTVSTAWKQTDKSICIDGALRAKLYTDSGECAGCAYLVFPKVGTVGFSGQLSGICVRPKPATNYTVKIEPVDLWELASKGNPTSRKTDNLTNDEHRKIVADSEAKYQAELG